MLYTTPGGASPGLFLDALRQPHLLIAGATGSGKSVIINGLIYTALHFMPDEKQLILIDPKRVELSLYRNTPHCIRYASEPGEMLEALRQAMTITEDRYKTMQRRGLRKYDGGDVYVIIDEFADLILTDRDIKPLVQRLAQIGRAANVHIILATQTPIARVIPTEIKCNFDARFGLRTRSAQDSRNIINRAGLENLPQYGQAVYMTPQGEALYNVPYIPAEELERIAEHWNRQRHLFGRLQAARELKTQSAPGRG